MRPGLNPVAASGEGRMNAPPTGTESSILVGAAFMRPVKADVYPGPGRYKWRPYKMTLAAGADETAGAGCRRFSGCSNVMASMLTKAITAVTVNMAL